MGAFYETFDPEEARELVRRIEFRYTPKHGSWLNVSENELSSLTLQCLANRRITTVQTLRKETATWSERSNKKQQTVDLHFTINDARNKLKALPEFQKLPQQQEPVQEFASTWKS